MKISRFEDLECWQEARKLVNMVYEAINSSPAFQRDRRLKDQCTGAGISTMGGIPEGFARRSNKEFIQYLSIFSRRVEESFLCGTGSKICE